MNVTNGFGLFKAELQAIPPSKAHRNNTCFSEAYEEIELHLARNASQKTILDAFNTAYDLRVSPTRFRQLMDAERKRRQEQGNVMTCPSCGQHLVAKDESAWSLETEDNDGGVE
jgi:hypothetical protein